MCETYSTFDIGLGLEDTHVLVTGGAGQIGIVVVQAFLAAGSFVTAWDINESKMSLKHEKLRWKLVDVTDERQVEQALESATAGFGLVTSCIALAGLDLSFLKHHQTIADMPFGQWRRTLNVNLDGTFLTSRAWLRQIRLNAKQDTRNISLVLTGSSAGTWGVRTNCDYATSKAAVQSMVRSLAPDIVSIHPRARVNALAPGAMDTPQFRLECAQDPIPPTVLYADAQSTMAQRTPVPLEAVARMCLFLASERYSGSITGQILPVDGGQQGKLMYLPNGTPC